MFSRLEFLHTMSWLLPLIPSTTLTEKHWKWSLKLQQRQNAFLWVNRCISLLVICLLHLIGKSCTLQHHTINITSAASWNEPPMSTPLWLCMRDYFFFPSLMYCTPLKSGLRTQNASTMGFFHFTMPLNWYTLPRNTPSTITRLPSDESSTISELCNINLENRP